MISGTNLSLQAQVDDDTATVTAQITDASGDTNTVQGLVERSGLIWANNLPLAAGTNFLTVTATDAGGYSATTNLTVVQSAVTVTVDPLPGNQLNQSSVTVTGTVSDTNETVYVNGVTATVHADGTWTACMVPASSTETSTFNVQAYSSDSTLDGSQASSQPQPPALVLMSYQMQTGHSSEGTGENQSIQWDYLAGGDWSTRRYPTGNGSASGWSANDPDIPPDGTDYTSPVVTSDQGETFAPTWQISEDNIIENGENLQTSTKLTLGIVPGGQTPMGGIAHYVVVLAANEFSDLNDDNNIFGLNMGGASQGDLPDPPGWIQVNDSTPLTDMGITNADGTRPGFATFTGPADAITTFTLTSTQSSLTKDKTFPQSDIQPMNLELTVVSNSAVQINGTTNWATVENPSNYVIVQATLNPANSMYSDWFTTNLAWSGGTPVPGNPLQCEVSTAASTNITVTASVGSYTNSIEVWVIWGTVQIFVSGNNPTNAPSFIPAGESNQLGVVYYGNSNSAAGQICAIATITPAGVPSVITNGWNVFQYRMSHDFDDGHPSSVYFDSTWQPDGPQADFKTTSPDTGNMLYTIDGPNIASFQNTNSSETYNNFYDYITWNSQICCATNNLWHFEGRWKFDQTPQITFTLVETGNLTLPSSPYYAP
jgi:hypothetical protein